MSNPIFWENKKKNDISFPSAEFAQRAVKVKIRYGYHQWRILSKECCIVGMTCDSHVQ